MKKLIFTTLIVSMMLNISVFANEITVLETSKFSKLIDAKIIKPTEINDDIVTKTNLVMLINRLLNYTKETVDISNTKSFLDCEQKWYDNELKIARTVGYVLGDEKNMVNPEHILSRQEACVILSRAFYIMPSNQDINFTDNQKILSWAKPYINTMYEKNYIKDMWPNELKPTEYITNKEVLVIISQIIGTPITTQPSKETTFDGNTTVFGEDITLSNTKINGDLIVLPSALNIKINDLTISGDLKYIN